MTKSTTRLKLVVLSAMIFFGLRSYAQYCTPVYTTGTVEGDYCSYVGLGTISNTTAGAPSPFYSDYTAMSTDITIGLTYTITLGAGSYTSNNDIAVWIDYNHDLDFGDAGEYVAAVPDLGAFATGTDDFIVPVGAIGGPTRMRVREIWNMPATPDPCATYSYGETEDYTVNILGGSVNDVGVIDITNPVSGVTLGLEDVIVTIYNFGSDPASGFPVYYQVDGGLITGGTYLGTIDPYSSASYTMPEGYDFSADGCYDITAWTAMDGDDNAANDSYTETVCNLGPITGTGTYYIYSNVFGIEPWGSTSNTDAMNSAFGPEGTAWTRAYFETVDPLSVFNPDNCFVFLEGSDFMANELESFLTANMSTIESWVSSGGKLLLNAAPNEGDGMSFGFGGTSLVYSWYTANATAADAGHPIFNGPALPCGTSFSGTSFGHARITGTGLTNVILDADAMTNVVLAEKTWGDGVVMFGGMTTANWHDPDPNAQNLRSNIFSYLGCVAPVCEVATGLYADGITSTTAELHWEAAEGATDYLVTVADRATKTVVVKTAVTTTDYSATGLTPGGSYYFKVRTYCTDVPMVADVSYKYLFTTPAREGDLGTSVSLYPNPTSGQFGVTLNGFEGQSFNLVVYNSVGQIVYNAAIDVTASDNNFVIDLGNAAQGMYHVRLVNENTDMSYSLIVSH